MVWFPVVGKQDLMVVCHRLAVQSLWPAEAALRHATTTCSWSNSSLRSSARSDTRLPCSNANGRGQH
jgi:hypothetical protein